MDKKQHEKLIRYLYSNIPLFGSILRGFACKKLFAECSPEAIAALCQSLNTKDKKLRSKIEFGLTQLKNQDAIDALCELWLKNNDSRLADIVKGCGYVASKPIKVRVLSALKSGKLEACVESAEAVTVTAGEIDSSDTDISSSARAALTQLKNQDAIDALCEEWVKSRSVHLRAIIRNCGYIASAPALLRVQTKILCGKTNDLLTSADAVPHVAAALSDADSEIAAAAQKALCTAATSRSDIANALCNFALPEPNGLAAKLCNELRLIPTDSQSASLFLFVMNRLDEYFELDPEFQNLRIEYERAPQQIRELVMNVYRSGDRRCIGFISNRSKPIVECNEQEIAVALESYKRHKDWRHLFEACLSLPLKYTLKAIGSLFESQWIPDDPSEQSLFKAMQEKYNAEGLDTVKPTGEPRQEESAEDDSMLVFIAQCLRQGRESFATESEDTLIEKLNTADPIQGIKIVGALAARSGVSKKSLEAVSKSKHWLVQLAAVVSELYLPTPEQMKDEIHWIKAIVNHASFSLELSPWHATPKDLEKLRTGTVAEARVGKLGTIQQILELLLAYRITTPELAVPQVTFEDGMVGDFR